MSKISSFEIMTKGLGMNTDKVIKSSARRWVIFDYNNKYRKPFVMRDLITGDQKTISVKTAKYLLNRGEE
tara:strand:- start:243 stop:452 length:210 start_codon:yes stop_codon:yes gene_type:complete